jgi:two-component system sensor histidine kinase/response regulator
MSRLVQCTFKEVQNGLQSVEAVRKEEGKYDLIFMDCNMPKMDGFTASQIISSEYPELPIIANSAYPDKYEKKCMKSGMKYFFQKPNMIKELEKILTHIFK